MKNILILGASGFIGRHLLKSFGITTEAANYNNKKNICIIKFDRDFEHGSKIKSIDLYDFHLNHTKHLKNLILKNKINTMIHLASRLIPSSSESEYEREVKDLINPSHEIFELAAKLEIKTLYISSGGTVYGNNYNPKEEDKLSPVNFYGKSKVILEDHLRSFDSKNFKYLILRPSNVYGAFSQVNLRQGLISNAINSISNNTPIKVWGSGSAIRDYVFIDNLIDVILTFIKEDIDSGSYNVGSATGHSVLEVIKILENCLDKKAIIETIEGVNEGVKSNILNISKLQSVMEYKPTDLQYGIRKTLKNLNLLI